MTDKEMLRKAFQKAYGENFLEEVFEDEIKYGVTPEYVRQAVFEHSFAKAFWGEESISPRIIGAPTAWKYHLQQMVLEEEPLKYLAKFLIRSENENSERIINIFN